MRIVRFPGKDDRILLGEDLGNGSARVLLDAASVLGPGDAEAAVRETLRGRNGIVADDDEGIRKTIGRVLDKFECSCVYCKDGTEALEAIRNVEADFVVSDIVMPDHDGYEVFAAAKEHRADMPVVLITGFGYDPSHAIVRATTEGLDGVLYKPFSPRQLVRRIAEAVQQADGCPAGSLVRTTDTERVKSRLVPLVPRDVVCVGRNYPTDADPAPQAHDVLEVFLKPTSALVAHNKPIRIPRFPGVDPEVHCEGELGVVIGRTARHIDVTDARRHVLGYVIANDVTARRWQKTDVPMAWMRGKGFETFCPVGPAVVTGEDVPDPGALEIITRINGDVVGQVSTSNMRRSVDEIIAELSAHMTLHPGTLLLTGGPPGDERCRLKPGDEVEIEIEGIGTLANPVVEA